MLTCKDIIRKLKSHNATISHTDLSNDIKIVLQGKVKCSEACDLLRILYHFISSEENLVSKHELPNYNSCIEQCVEYLTTNFSSDELMNDQFLQVLFHVTRVQLTLHLFNSALKYGGILWTFVSDNGVVFPDKDTYIKSLGGLFWNEAYHLEKKNTSTHEIRFELRKTSISFYILKETLSSITDKVSTTLIKYCDSNDNKNVSLVKDFLENIWTKLGDKRIDNNNSFALFKLVYSCLEISLKYCNDVVISQCIASWLLEIPVKSDKSATSNIISTCIQISEISIKIFVLGEKIDITKFKLCLYKKLLEQNEFPKSHIDFVACTCRIFYSCFLANNNSNDKSAKNPSWFSVKSNLDFCIKFVCLCLKVSPKTQKNDKWLSFSFKMSSYLAHLLLNVFGSLITDDDYTISNLVKEAKQFIEYSLHIFNFYNESKENENSFSGYAIAIGNFGSLLYSKKLYSETTYFLEVSCSLLSQFQLVKSVNIKSVIWKKREVLIHCYYLSGLYKKALCMLVKMMVQHEDKVKECMEMWQKIKRDARRNHETSVLSCTVSEIIMEIQSSACIEFDKALTNSSERIDWNKETELALLYAELKSCKHERYCSSEEMVAVALKILEMETQNHKKGYILLEILNFKPSISEMVSQSLEKTLIEMCSECVQLLTNHLEKNNDDTVKIQLSVAYFSLYYLKLEHLKKVAEEDVKAVLRSPSDSKDEAYTEKDENDTCDIKPAFPLINVFVELQIVNDLELALEIWTEVFKDIQLSNSVLADIIQDWDLLNIIQTVAEIFALRSHDMNELKSWILLRNIASSLEKREHEMNALISLVNFSIRFGLLPLSLRLLDMVKNLSTNNHTEELKVIELKLKMAESNYLFHSGEFDKGLELLQNIFQHKILGKNYKSTRLLQVELHLLKSQYLSVPPPAYKDDKNIEIFTSHTAITATLEGASFTKGLYKTIAEKPASETSSNNWMAFKIVLLKNSLKAYLQLSELYLAVGEARYSRCYLKEALRLAESHILTYWSIKALTSLGKIDLMCDSFDDCLVKLNGLKYIVDESAKENALNLLTKAYSKNISDVSLNSSEDFILPEPQNLALKRRIKQNFVNNDDVCSSPIPKKKSPLVSFEMKTFMLSGYSSMFSMYLVCLEIWNLSCLYHISKNNLSYAEGELKKLFKVCQKMNMSNFCSTLDSGSLGLPFSKHLQRSRTCSEVILMVDTLYCISALQFVKNSLKDAQSYWKLAYDSLSELSSNAKYSHPSVFSLLKYFEILLFLKSEAKLDPDSSVSYYICPSVQGSMSISRKAFSSENRELTKTPQKTNVMPQIVVSQHKTKRQICLAPMKKDLIPSYLKKDLSTPTKSLSTQLLDFSSSEDEFISPKALKPRRNKENMPSNNIDSNNKSKIGRKGTVNTNYKLFKSKNSNLNINSASDVWKCPVFTTPKASKKSAKSKSLKVDAISRTTRMSRQTKNTKSDSSVSQTMVGNLQAYAKKTESSTKNQKVKKNAISKILDDSSDDFVTSLKNSQSIDMNSIEVSRKSPKSGIMLTASKDQSDADEQYPDVFLQVQNTPVNSLREIQLNSIVSELCNDINSMAISKEKEIVVPEEKLDKYIKELYEIKTLIQHSSPFPLYADVCQLLAVLIMAKVCNPSKSALVPLECNFLLSEAISSPLNHIHITNMLYYNDKTKDLSNKYAQNYLKHITLSEEEKMKEYLGKIPKDWTVIQINSMSSKEISSNPLKLSKLIISQFTNGSAFTVCVNSSLASMFSEKIFSEFENILLENSMIMKHSDNAKKWWQTRSTLDLRLKEIVKNMENLWLGCWKALFLGEPKNKQRQKKIAEIAERMSRLALPSNKDLLKVVIDSTSFYTREQLSAAICYLWQCTPFDDTYSKLYKEIADSSAELPTTERHPVIMILDKNIQCLPWENLPILTGIPVSRMPSLSVMYSKLYGPETVFPKEIDTKKTFFVLNPSGDLVYSQTCLEPQFKKQTEWKGITGIVPTSQQYLSAFKDYDLFLYCGHGSGNQYLQGVSVDKMWCRAASILMGCSSGRLKQIGKRMEPYGFVLTYLLRGCPCVVANLWDVTDKDIDRFTEKMLQLSLPSYNQEDTETTDMATAVSRSRQACKMRYLVGAAPVVYGLPVLAKTQ